MQSLAQSFDQESPVLGLIQFLSEVFELLLEVFRVLPLKYIPHNNTNRRELRLSLSDTIEDTSAETQNPPNPDRRRIFPCFLSARGACNF